MVRRSRSLEFKFFGDVWTLHLAGPARMQTMCEQNKSLLEAVGPDRVMVGLTDPDVSKVYLDKTLAPVQAVNIVVHELYHVAESDRYHGQPEELRATCIAEAAEFILCKLHLLSYEESSCLDQSRMDLTQTA